MTWLGLALALLVMSAVDIADADPLCIDGHPAPRPEVTYGHLKPRAGFERDHFIPLCLGGEDEEADDPAYPPSVTNPGNEEAHRKDADEKKTCEAYCAGPQTSQDLRDAIQGIIDRWSEH